MKKSKSYEYSYSQFQRKYKLISQFLPEQDPSLCVYQRKKTNLRFRAIKYKLGILTDPKKQEIRGALERFVEIKNNHLVNLKSFVFKNTSRNHSQLMLVHQMHESTLLEAIRQQNLCLNNIDIFEEISQLKALINEMNNKGILHNQISLDNIYIKGKLLVLGLPCFKQIYKFQRKNKQKRNNQKHFTLNIYDSPQIEQGYCRSLKSNIWALGIAACQLLLKKELKEINKDIIQKAIKQIDFIRKSVQMQNLLKSMLSENTHQQINQLSNKTIVKRIKIVDISSCFNNYIPIYENADNLIHKNIYKQHFIITSFTNPQDTSINLIAIKYSLYTSKESLYCVITQSLVLQMKNPQFKTIAELFSLLESHPIILTDSGIIYIQVSSDMEQQLSQDRCPLETDQLPFRRQLQNTEQIQAEKVRKNEQLISKISKYQASSPQNLLRIKRCMAQVTNELSQVYDGILIGDNFILTTSKSIFSKQLQYQIKQLEVKILHDLHNISDNSASLIYFYPLAFKNANQSVDYLYSYALLIIDNPVIRKRNIEVSYCYNEVETVSKLQNIGIKITFHYQLGHQMVIKSQQISFFYDMNLFRLNFNVQSTVRSGCPLLVVFSNNHCYVIGIYCDQNEGFMFNEKVMLNLWRWIQKSKFAHIKFDQLSMKIQRWNQVSINFPKSPNLTLSLLFLRDRNDIDSQMHYHNQQREYTINQLRQINSIQQIMLSYFLKSKPLEILVSLQSWKPIIRKYYGPNSELEYRMIYHLLKVLQMNDQQDMLNQQFFHRTIKIQELSLNNIYRYLGFNFIYVKILNDENIPTKAEQAIGILKANFIIAESLNLTNELISFYIQFCNAYSILSNYQEASRNQCKAVETAWKQKQYNRLINPLIFQIGLVCGLRKVKRLIRCLEIGFQTLYQNQSLRVLYWEEFRNHWKKAATIILTTKITQVEIVEKFISLTSTYLQEERSTIPIFQQLIKRIKIPTRKNKLI